MKKRLELTTTEMMQLRKDGYSNKDIANILDISIATVYRYIGKQKRHMESVTTRPNTTTAPPEKPPESTKKPQGITVISRVVSIDGYLFEIPSVSSSISVAFADGQSVKMDDVDGFINAIAKARDYMNKQRTPNE